MWLLLGGGLEFMLMGMSFTQEGTGNHPSLVMAQQTSLQLMKRVSSFLGAPNGWWGCCLLKDAAPALWQLAVRKELGRE